MPTNEYRIMTQQRGGVNLAQHIPCRLYPVNIPIELQVSGSVPVDLWNLWTDWVTLNIQRSDYFVDEVSGAKYSVYGQPMQFISFTKCQVSKPTGVTP